MADTAPFYRMGEPNIIPVSPTSAINQFTIVRPKNATSFRIINNNPFAVRLAGTPTGKPFVLVTTTTGWLWMPGVEAIYGTVNPLLVSAMSVDGPFAATDPTQKAGVGVLELQYGTGA